MVSIPLPGGEMSVRFQFTELEGAACIPRELADTAWERGLREQLVARAASYAREAGEFVRETLPGPHTGDLWQRADWHGGRCVLEYPGRHVFIKPKPVGAEAVIYRLFSCLFKEKLGCAVEAPFRRVSTFIVQETIESTRDAADARAFGLALGLIFAAAITDLNAENLRVCRGIPLPIDVECALDVRFYDAPPATILRRLREQTHALLLALPKADGAAGFDWGEYRAYFVEGAAFGCKELKAALSGQDQITDWKLRRVVLPTRVYLEFIRRQAIFRWDTAEATRRWMALRRNSANKRVVQAEAASLCMGDVPLFHQHGGCLLDGVNDEVVEDGWRPPRFYLEEHLTRWDRGALRALAARLSVVGR